MPVIVWIVLALLVALAFVYAAARRARTVLPALVLPPGESLPVAPLQRLVRWVLAVEVLLIGTATAIVVYHGPQVYWDDDQVRLTVMALIISALMIFTIVPIQTARWLASGGAKLDERDRAILATAPAGQAGAMLVTLAAWMIGLTETHVETHLVPSVFLYLMFWSCLMASLMAWLSGILLGYRQR